MKNYREKNLFNKVANPQQVKKMGKKSYNGLQKNFKKNGNFVNQWGVLFLEKV